MDWYATCYIYYMWCLPRFLTQSQPNCFMFHENYVHCKTVIKSFQSSRLWKLKNVKILRQFVIRSKLFLRHPFNYSIQFQAINGSVNIFSHFMLNNHTNITNLLSTELSMSKLISKKTQFENHLQQRKLQTGMINY